MDGWMDGSMDEQVKYQMHTSFCITGWINERMASWLVGWKDDGWRNMNEWVTWWIDEWINGQIDRCVDGCMDGWLDGWMDGWVNGWLDRWVQHNV